MFGIGQVQNGRLVLGDRLQHGGLVEFEIRGQIDADETQALQLRTHPVHHEAGHRRHDGRTRHVAGHGQHRDQFVRTIAQHQVEAVRDLGMGHQRPAQVIDTAIGIAVERQCTQALAQLLLQRGRQTMRILHRVELVQSARVLNRIGMHAGNVAAQRACHQFGERNSLGSHIGS